MVIICTMIRLNWLRAYIYRATSFQGRWQAHLWGLGCNDLRHLYDESVEMIIAGTQPYGFRTMTLQGINSWKGDDSVSMTMECTYMKTRMHGHAYTRWIGCNNIAGWMLGAPSNFSTGRRAYAATELPPLNYVMLKIQDRTSHSVTLYCPGANQPFFLDLAHQLWTSTETAASTMVSIWYVPTGN